MRFRCNNVACGQWPRCFEFEDRGGECPKCGMKGPPQVATLIDVHFMLMTAKGPISGRMGRQMVACQPDRAYLCRHPSEPFAATDDPRAVTCPKCVRLPCFREQAQQYEELAEMLGSPVKLTVDMGSGKG